MVCNNDCNSCNNCDYVNNELPIYRRSAKTFPDFFSDIYPEKFSRDVEYIGINSTITKNVTFIVTDECNLRCTYCYQHNKGCAGGMSKETAKKCVDLLFEEYESNGRYINDINAQAIILDFIGGEPLIEIELIDWIVDYFRMTALQKGHPWALNYWISISTNGILYDDSRVEKFIEKNKGRLSLSISLDGNKDLHDSCRLFPDGSPSYDLVINNFKKHMAKFLYVETKLTLAPENVEHFYAAHKHMIELGVKNLYSNTVYEKGWDINHAKVIYEQSKQFADYVIDNNHYEDIYISYFDEYIGSPMDETDNKNWCGGTGAMLAFDSQGKIYPCLRYAPLSLKTGIKPIIIGDLDLGIDNTKEHNQIVTELDSITRKSQSTEECYNCTIASGCAWCSAYNYEETGTPNKRVTYICDMHKSRVLATSYYYNKIYKKLNIDKRFDLNIPKDWALKIISEEEYNMLKDLAK